jgi:predicted nucleic acid-binding protein
MSEPARQGVLDTNVVILMGGIGGRSALPAEAFITTVTLAELSVGPLVTEDPDERAQRQERLQYAETTYDPLPFDAAAARQFGRVAASLRRHGRTEAARRYDAMIAATAMASGLDLHTCNPDDYRGIDGLTVVTVPRPDQLAG